VEAFQIMHLRVTFIDTDLMAQVIWICYNYNGTLIIPSLCIIAKPGDFWTVYSGLWLQYCGYSVVNSNSSHLELLKEK